jgi:hypothetical protein
MEMQSKSGWSAMEERESRIAMFEACHGSTYEPYTKKPKEPPNRFEEFDAECAVCHQRVPLATGTDRLKLHYAKCLSTQGRAVRPKKWHFWRRTYPA